MVRRKGENVREESREEEEENKRRIRKRKKSMTPVGGEVGLSIIALPQVQSWTLDSGFWT